MSDIQKIDLQKEEFLPGEGIAEAMEKEPVKSPKKFRINFDFTKAKDLLRSKKFQKWGLITLAVFFVLIVLPVLNVFFRARAVGRSADLLIETAKSGDIVLIKEDLGRTKIALGRLKGSLFFIGWTKFIPFFGGYTRDVGHVVNAASYGLEAGEI